MLAFTLASLFLACPVHPAILDQELVQRSLPALPPDLARQLAKHPQALRRGAQVAANYPHPLHFRGGKNAVEEAVFAQSERLVHAIRSQTSFEEVTAGFGILAHLVLDLYFPVQGSDAVAFSSFLTSRLSRIPVVFYALEASLPFQPREELWRSLLSVDPQARALGEALREDFTRVGGAGNWQKLDDRSTAFGVASVTFNRATSHYAAVASWVWRNAGGLVIPLFRNGNSILVWKGELKPRETALPPLRLR
ncbi:MAG: hypothetical protein ACUVRE_09035 [Thermoanaerobaculaceae bacterium]